MSNVYDLIFALKGILYNENVNLDYDEIVPKLEIGLPTVLSKGKDETSWYLLKFFLPPPVINEMDNTGMFSDDMFDLVNEVIQPLFADLCTKYAP